MGKTKSRNLCILVQIKRFSEYLLSLRVKFLWGWDTPKEGLGPVRKGEGAGGITQSAGRTKA